MLRKFGPLKVFGIALNSCSSESGLYFTSCQSIFEPELNPVPAQSLKYGDAALKKALSDKSMTVLAR